jgi:glycosyltransferase involved in cell wall biosynthesis
MGLMNRMRVAEWAGYMSVLLKRLSDAIGARLIMLALYTTGLLSACLRCVRRARSTRPYKAQTAGITVEVAATFYNRNWCRAHLMPIARAPGVGRVIAVVDGPSCAIPKVEYVAPSRIIQKTCGRLVAKLAMMLRVCLREKPDVVIGYALVPNGVWAMVAASLTGAAVIYQNTAGPSELIGGGWNNDNVILKRLRWDSWPVEKMAYALTRCFDAVVVRGKEGVGFLRRKRIARRPFVLVGTVDSEKCFLGRQERIYDIITVCRLVEIKQVHHLLAVVKTLKRARGNVKAVIIGDGPLLEDLRRQAIALDIEDNVRFLGQVDGVENVLRQSRVFVLTSRMEGLSIALAEAMGCGLPAVVADVGELRELVEDGVTGWCVMPGDIECYARRIGELLDCDDLWQRMSVCARARALENNGVEAVASRWGTMLGEVAR